VAEIRSLTGLRGVAALTVFFAHTLETLREQGFALYPPVIVERLFLSGGRQVDIFFVLSGFILAATYKSWFDSRIEPAAYWKFLQRRFARIYPLHAAILIGTIALVAGAKLTQAPTRFGLDRFEFSTLPQHFLLIHAWNLFGEGEGQWNPPSWSISVEALAYLLFPLMLISSRGWREHRPWLLLGLTVLVGAAINSQMHWGIYGIAALGRGLTEFALGCAVANLVDSRTAHWLQTTTGSLLAAAVVIIGFALTPDTSFAIGLVTAPLLLSLLAANPVSRAIGSPVVYFLGEISYSVYLGHFILSSMFYRLISVAWMKLNWWHAVIGIVGITVFVLAISTLTYYTIERPARDYLSGRRRKRSGGTSVTAGVGTSSG